MLHASIGIRRGVDEIPLHREGATWADQFAFQIVRDGQVTHDCQIELIGESVRFEVFGEAAMRLSAAGTNLRAGHLLMSTWRLVARDGAVPRAGLYEVQVGAKPGANAFFGCDFFLQMDFRILLRAAQPADRLRLQENIIERHYRTGIDMREWDKPAGEAHLHEAKALVEELLRSGAGDEDGLYNVTPRHQAARIYQDLGLYQDAIAMITRVIQGLERECKMRHAHFGRERGSLPRTAADHLLVTLQQLRAKQALQPGEAPGSPRGGSGAP